jgi:hypothetical protein
MIRRFRCNAAISSLIAVVAVLLLAPSHTQAQVVKHFKVKGGGIADYIPIVPFVPVGHNAIGEATELGRYHGDGQFQLLAFTSPTTANFDSAVPFVFVAANGDQLACTYGDVTN